MAGKPQKNLAYSVLLDFYGPVLTDKQRVILTEYYDEDLSLAEIAENLGITRCISSTTSIINTNITNTFCCSTNCYTNSLIRIR